MKTYRPPAGRTRTSTPAEPPPPPSPRPDDLRFPQAPYTLPPRYRVYAVAWPDGEEQWGCGEMLDASGALRAARAIARGHALGGNLGADVTDVLVVDAKRVGPHSDGIVLRRSAAGVAS